MNKITLFSVLTFLFFQTAQSQELCGLTPKPLEIGFMDDKIQEIKSYDNAEPKSVKYIPIVVHVATGDADGNDTKFDAYPDESDKRDHIISLFDDVTTLYFEQEDLNFYVCDVIFYYNDDNPANGLESTFFDAELDHHYQNVAVPTVLNAYFHYDGGDNWSYGSLPPSYPMIWMRSTSIGLIAHELGHVGGLFHTFGNDGLPDSDENATRDESDACFNCDTAGDRVCDTDADGGAYNQFTDCNDEGTFGTDNCDKPLQYNASNLKNFMSYNNDCYDSFTTKQYIRMNYFWDTYYQGFFSPPDTECDISYASFSMDKQLGCENMTVNFQDLSYNATSWLWDFGDGNQSTSQNPSHTYSNSGTYNVKLTINGGDKEVTRTQAVGVSDNTTYYETPFFEDFESGSFPADWVIENVGFNWSLGWEVTNDQLYNCPETSSSITGIDGDETFALSTDNWAVANNSYAINTPEIVLGDAREMYFDLFYKHSSGWCTDANCLTLKVEYATDCYDSWNTLFDQSNTDLSLDEINNKLCVTHPSSADDWRSVYIDLSSLPNDEPIRFKFTVINKEGGEPVYIDNINITNSFGGEDRTCPGIIGSTLLPDAVMDSYTYSWSPSEGLDNPSSANPFANPFNETTYTVNVYDNGVLAYVDQVTVSPGYDTDNIAINGNQVWDENSTNVPEKVRGTILIKRGAKLTIKNRTIQFGPNHNKMYIPDLPEPLSGISVEPGGELVLNNATLTSLDNCDNILWGGVELFSSVRLLQTTNKLKSRQRNVLTQVPRITQPKITSSNQTVIENAIKGINFGYSRGGLIDTRIRFYGNGLGEIKNTLFRNNHTSITFMRALNRRNSVAINSNTFEVDNLYHPVVDESFLTSADYSEPTRFISMSRSNIMEIEENHFEDKRLTNQISSVDFLTSNFSKELLKMTGVESFASGHDCINNTFEGLKIGVDVYGVGIPTSLRIERNNFEQVYAGIALQNTNSTTVTDNNIKIYDTHLNNAFDQPINNEEVIDGVYYPSYGIFAITARRALIAHNEIRVLGSAATLAEERISRGIVVHNSGTHGAEVMDNIVGDQETTEGGFGVAFEAQEDNPALRFTCNRFANNQQAVRLNTGGLGGTLAHQSSECEDVQNPVVEDFFPENEFMANASGNNEHLFADASLTAPDGTFFRYFDNAKALHPADPDNGGVSQILLDNESYDNCIFEEQTELQDYPDPSCEMGITEEGGGVIICCDWAELTVPRDALLRQGIENDIFRKLLREEREEELIDFLKENSTPKRDRERVGLYLQTGQLEQAKELLNTLSNDDHQTYKKVMSMVLEQEEKNEPLDSLKVDERDVLRNLAANNLPVAGTHPVAVAAQGMLQFSNTQKFDRWVLAARPEISDKSMNSEESHNKAKKSEITKNISQEKTPKLYPNPTSNIVTVEYEFEKNAQLYLYEVSGQKVHSQVVTAPTERVLLPMDTFNNGVYFLKVITSQQQFMHKVIKN